jgi:hypothetical protein
VDRVKRLVIGDVELVAGATQRGSETFISSVTVIFDQVIGHSKWKSIHEWEHPLFESEAEAVKFAWQRAITMARSIDGQSSG